MTDYYADFRQFAKRFLKVVGKALCSGSYRVTVHTVGARTHDTAQSPGAKFEIFIE